MKLSLGQAKQALELAQSAVGNLNVKMGNNGLPAWQKAQLEKELRLQSNAVIYWSSEFRRLGGGDEVIMAIDNLYARRRCTEEITHEMVTETQKAMKATEAFVAKTVDLSEFRDKVTRLRNSQSMIVGHCQQLLNASDNNANAIGSGLTHLFGGGSMATPYKIIGWATITAEIGAAEHYWDAGKPELAEGKLKEAAFKLLQAARQLDLYEAQIGVGGERAEAVLKITAALAMLIASGGTLGVGGAMAVAVTGEAATQGTLLALAGADGKTTISTDDLKNAALEVAIAGGSAGIGKYAEKLGKAFAPTLLQRALGRKPTEKEVEWAVKRLVNYIAANAGYWSKRGFGLDKEKDTNWWLIALAPALGEIPVELAKEQSVNRAVGEQVGGGSPHVNPTRNHY